MSVSKTNGKKSEILFVISLIFKFLFAASFLLMPPASDISLNDGKQGFLYFVGVLFWVSLIISQITMIVVTIQQKKYYKGKDTKDLPGKPAIITFFYTKEAKIADILMCVSIVGFILSTILTDSYLIYVFLFLSVLMIQIHCVLNGKNLIYLKEIKDGGKA